MEIAAADSNAPREDRETQADRLLDFVAGDRPDSFDGIATFLAILCFHVGLRHVHLGFQQEEPTFWASGAIALAVAAGCLVEKRTGSIRFSLPLIAVSVLLFASQKIALGNHAALEALLLLAIAIAVPVTNARARSIGALIRWSTILLFFHSGLQKLVYGAYFNGSFLARRVGDERFAWLLEIVLPDREYQALLEADRFGPMVFSSPLGLLLSNSVYLAEIGCALLLLIPRTRTLGLVASMATIFGIEVVAREVGFGLMFVFMLLLFRPAVYESRWILLLPLGAHVALGLTDLIAPGVLLW